MDNFVIVPAACGTLPNPPALTHQFTVGKLWEADDHGLSSSPGRLPGRGYSTPRFRYPPAAVIPSKERLKSEQCKEIYDRFTQCPFYPKMIQKARVQGCQKCVSENDCVEKSAPPAPEPSPYSAPAVEGPPAP